MIKDPRYYQHWENRYLARESAAIERNLELAEAMYEEARKLGKMAIPDPLEDLEHLFLYAKAINVQNPPR
jgi:hypothetical protein